MAKGGKKSSKTPFEPTLHDVMGTLHTMTDWMHNTTDVRFANIERGQNKLVLKVEDLQDDVTSALAAIDKDTEMIYDHERRIKKLERAR